MIRATLVAVVVVLCASTAKADFRVTGYAYPGPVNDVFEIYALNDGTNGTGTRAVSADVTLFDYRAQFPPVHSPGEFPGTGFIFKYVDNTIFAPADLTGVTLYSSSGHNPAVLFGGTQDRTFMNLLGDEATANPNAYVTTLTSPDNDGFNYTFTLITHWEQAGNVPGGVDASSAANGGRGALIAVGVVRHGEGVIALGTIEGLNGVANRFQWPATPEPGSAALMALGLGITVLRRGRA